ncbi:MAG: hypothetical protein ACKVZJ_13185 [Phycisphaerales bacterium]
MPLTLALELSANHTFVLLLMAVLVSVPIIGIIASAASSSTKSKAREQTRRELAAYVAEGSMTADEAERILKAGKKKEDGSGCEW